MLVDIDKMQYGFISGKRTVDAAFILRLAEKFRSKNKKFSFCVGWSGTKKKYPLALRREGVPEYLVNGVMLLYKGCKTPVLVEGELSDSFSVKVGVPKGSALIPLF